MKKSPFRQFSVMLSILILFTLIACTSKSSTQQPNSSEYVVTDIKNYSAAGIQNMGNTDDVFLGLIKVFAEHGLKDNKGSVGTYRTQGTGCLVIYKEKWFVLTARHIVVPNPEIESIILDQNEPNKKIDFDGVVETGSRIAVGNTGIEPITIWLPTDDNVDIAVLEIPREMERGIIYRTLESVDPQYFNDENIVLTLGDNLDAWGYPARQSPQMEDVILSDIMKGYFVLNKALAPGFSGGLVIAPTEDSKKNIVGMVIRSDAEINQSTAIAWNQILTMLNAIANQTSAIKNVGINNSLEYQGVPFTYYPFHQFPYSSTQPKEWWEFWK